MVYTNAIRAHIFITGAPRSGTTLLDKILHAHHHVCIGSQPFPFLFYKAKDTFYREKGINCMGYPLGPLFRERSYVLQDFTEYIETRVFTGKEVFKVFEDMEGYKGHLTKELQNYRDKIHDGTFYDIFCQLAEFICEIFGKTDVRYAGTKEAFCEEFVPLFLNKNVKVINIIRDPRDVLVSAYFGKGAEYVGKGLPILYVLRNWRKSVAFSLAYQDNLDFLFIKYEDLAKNSTGVLERLTAFLNLEPFPEGQFKEGIFDQRGNLWKGNSSFGQHNFISNSSTGKFKELLSRDTIRYIESICYPELLALGYDLYTCDAFDESIVRDFHEPFEVDGNKISADYSTNLVHVEEEVQRYKLLSLDAAQSDKNEWFIFPKAYDSLRKAIHA